MREIDNLGIFLTDNKRLAEFFGQNRAEGIKNTSRFELYTLLVDTGRILYMDNLPSQQKRLANELLYNYHGSRQRLSPQNYWWLLDKPEFIDSIRKKYDTVVFNEKPKIMKMAGVNYGKTFFVMNPDRIEIYKPLRFLELKDNIDFYLSEYVHYLDRTK